MAGMLGSALGDSIGSLVSTGVASMVPGAAETIWVGDGSGAVVQPVAASTLSVRPSRARKSVEGTVQEARHLLAGDRVVRTE